ncbi:MAG: heliorhodopsin HeR [Nocardioides sp.]
MTSSAPAPSPARNDLERLRRWNLGLSVLHLAQAIAVIALASSFTVTVTSSFPQGPPGSATPAPDNLFDVRIGAAIAVFLVLAALDHALTGSLLRRRYEQDLAEGINRFRWTEYSLSATLMVILIAFYAGITDIAAIVALAGVNISMILFGWLQEATSGPNTARPSLLPFWFGCVAGATPWVAIGVNVIGADTVPGFVYGIFVSLFVFFNCFALNQWLQYRRVGPWADYLFGERVYLVLSLVAKSALAWQIFAGSLAG